MLDKIGGRKFIGFLIISFMFFILTVLKILPVDSFVAFITANFGIYVAGNVSNTLAKSSIPFTPEPKYTTVTTNPV